MGGAFTDCVGVLDRTILDFQNCPGLKGPAYFDWKSNYGMNMQAVCDWGYLFTYLSVGFPTSMHDSPVFKATALCHELDTFFDGVSEYLLADKAYALTTQLLTPYKVLD
jgi:hypothetical protein